MQDNLQQNESETKRRWEESFRQGPDKEKFSSQADATKLAIASLLIQFSNTQVCGDFISGEFKILNAAGILSGLDELRCMLLPRWQKGSLIGQPRPAEAVKHFDLLVLRSALNTGTKYGGTDKFTYGEWFDVLESLAVDPYWSRVPTSDRCTHKIRSTDPLLSGPLQAAAISSGAIPKKRSTHKSDEVKPAIKKELHNCETGSFTSELSLIHI